VFERTRVSIRREGLASARYSGELIMIMRVGVLWNNKYFLTYRVGVFHIYLYLCA